MTSRWGSLTRSAVFAPLDDPGRAAGVERRLAEAVRSGLLADGERLPSETDLARMLGVAVVTAREALVGMRAQGLITTVRGRGGGSFVVGPAAQDDAGLRQWLASMSRVDLADRGVEYATLLAGCAELAAERATPDDVADLQGLLRATDRVDGPGEARQADTELHLAVAALTRSSRLARGLVRLEADFGALLRLPLGDPAHAAEVATHRAALVAAVAAGDPEHARAHARRRVRSALEHLVRVHRALR